MLKDGAMAPGPDWTYRAQVKPEWIDENNHLDSIHYKTIANAGMRGLFEALGLTRSLFAARESTMFQLEMHIRYLRELRLDDPIAVRSWVIASDAKRIHHFHEIIEPERGFCAATVELMTIYIDRASRRPAAMPAEIEDRISALRDAQATLPQPEGVGSRIGLR